MKKIKTYAIIATMVLFLGLSFSKVNAAESYTQDEQLAIDKLATTGVMIGTDTGFDGKSNLTRAQAAAIMVRVKGISEDEVEKERLKGTTKFKDVKKDHWALGYINIAYSYGLVKGVSDTEFNPEAKVKISELVTMAVRSLNAGNMVDGYTEEWPDNYMNFAKEEKLLTKVKSGKDSNATRIETALIVADTLEADVWKVSGVTTSKDGNKNTYAKQKGETLLKNVFNIDAYNDETVDSVSKSKKTASFKSSKVPSTTVDDKVDLSNLSSSDNVLVWYNTKTKKIVLIKNVEKGSYIKGKSINFSNMKSYTQSTGKLVFNVDGTNTTYYIVNAKDTDTICTCNGKKMTKKELNDYLLKSSTNLKELTGSVEITGTDIDYLYIGSYDKIGVASDVSGSKVYFFDEDDVVGTTAPSKITISEDTCVVTNLDGDELDIDGIKEGFIVKYYYDETNKKYHIMTYNKNYVGDVDSRSNTKIEVDDDEYTVNFIGTYSKPEEDEEIKIYLNSNDEVIMYSQDEDVIDIDEEDENDTKTNSYGVITQAYYSSKKLYVSFNGGTKKEVNVSDTYDLFSKKFDDEEELRDYIIEDCVGSFAQYKIEDGYYVLYEFGEYCASSADSIVVTPNERIKLSKTDKKIGTYSYKSPKIYEVVVKRNSSSNYSCTKKTISLSDLSNSKYYVSLIMDDGYVKEMTVFGDEETPVTPVTPTSPTTPANQETSGIVANVTNNTSKNRLDVNVITNGGVATFRIYGNLTTASDLKIGSYIKYELDGDIITKFTLNKTPKDVEKIKCKLIAKETYVTVRLSDDTTKNVSYDKLFLVKAGSITDTEEKFEVSNLSYTTSEPVKNGKDSKYADNGAECYVYLIDNKAVAILYR